MFEFREAIINRLPVMIAAVWTDVLSPALEPKLVAGVYKIDYAVVMHAVETDAKVMRAWPKFIRAYNTLAAHLPPPDAKKEWSKPEMKKRSKDEKSGDVSKSQ